jgi:hypothetical protein
MADNSKRIDYIDTQGLSPKLSPEEVAKLKSTPQQHKPMEVKPGRLLTPMMVNELKILINEVLDEREGKSGISYFDTDHFKYRVDEDEPPYEEWK